MSQAHGKGHYRELVEDGKITEDQARQLGKLQKIFETQSKDGRLWKIAHAASCRELWIHGELFLAGFHIGGPAIWKGKKPRNKNHSQETADFCTPKENPIIIGEVKFLWTRGFMEKGINLAGCLAKTRAGLPLKVRDLPKEWGPLVDYPRLRHASLKLVKPGTLRIFLLILARVPSDQRDDLGILLEEMELEETTPLKDFLKTKKLWVRAWMVDFARLKYERPKNITHAMVLKKAVRVARSLMKLSSPPEVNR